MKTIKGMGVYRDIDGKMIMVPLNNNVDGMRGFHFDKVYVNAYEEKWFEKAKETIRAVLSARGVDLVFVPSDLSIRYRDI